MNTKAPPKGGGSLKLRSDCSELTAKQREAIGLAALGHTCKTGAHVCGVTESTMAERLRLVRQKLHAKTTAHAVALYYAQWSGDHITEKGEFT